MPGAHSFRRREAACLCVIPRHPRPSLPLLVTELPLGDEGAQLGDVTRNAPGPAQGPEGAETRCPWEQLDGPVSSFASE